MIPYMEAVLRDRPKLYYPIIAGGNNQDFMGWAPDMVPVNAAIDFTDGPGRIGPGCWSNIGNSGSNYIATASAFSFPGNGGEITMEAWAKVTGGPITGQVVLEKPWGGSYTNPYYAWQLWVSRGGSGNYGAVNQWNSSGTLVANSFIGSYPADNTWVHIVGRIKPFFQDSWQNGTKVSTSTYTYGISTEGSNKLWIGRSGYYIGSAWYGSVAHVAVYDYYLPDDRVIAHYRTGISSQSNRRIICLASR